MRHIFLLLITTWVANTLNAQSRDVLFLGGIGGTSSDWNYFYINANGFGYQMNVMDPGPTGQGYFPGLEPVATSASNMNTMLVSSNKTNVLGIGHDGGGIVLRQMAKNSTTPLTGIILDGVPNQGSNATQKMIPGNQNPTTAVDALIASLENLRSATNDCGLCNVLGAFRIFSNNVKANSTRYQEYIPGHPTITSLGQPSIPYAVIWGNANKDNFALDRMLSSNGFAASGTYNDDLYVDCIKKKLDEKRATIQNAQVDAAINAVLGFVKIVKEYSGVVKEDGTVDQSKIPGAIQVTIESLQRAIRDARAINAAIADLLECELVHQVLNAQWNLIAGGGYTATSVTVTTTLPAEECCWSCYGEPEENQPECFTQCYNNNPNCTTTQTFVTLQSQPHDGLYSKNEQLLAGAANTYEAVQTNHFQEQGWFNTKAYFQPLFDGQNLAFKVPKL
jgi:hypothetical protein